MEMQSQVAWKGLQSQRFGGHRSHLTVEDSLGKGLNVAELPNFSNGIKCFEEKRSQEMPNKKYTRTYEHSYQPCTKEIDPRGKKPIDFVPTELPPRPEKAHTYIPECKQERVQRGIKTFGSANSLSEKGYEIEQKLQRKARVLGLDNQRNGLEVTSLGDKSYKYPEYASNFYQQGGLIAGSSNAARKKSNMRTSNQLDNIKIVPLTKPNWNERIKLDEEQQDKQYVKDIDVWEQTTLKEMNPNWKDPDRPPGGQESSKPPPKDAKKAGKK